ncbi:hypothetical protein LEM8419_02153 [Neolewinella maritima]|uniref:DEAD/DEAH box helicase n=2 Tax=Neolewinella maritima TaxID=1383882 RepID=A0ABM9B2A2_9BACT|nr:hypothetical protein LEM8419_02153 [Neolewinella maritima]
MRLITNHFYTTSDKEALLQGQNNLSASLEFSTHNITQIREALGSYGTHFFNCLAWLIAKDRIQFVVIRPKSGRGISHHKSGLVFDGVHKVIFSGSCNFTYSGLVENQESMIVNKSFDGRQSVKAIEEFETDFELLFTRQQTDQVEYLEPGNIQEVIIEQFGGRTIEQLLEDEKTLFSKIKPASARRIRKKKQQLDQLIEKILREPKFPYETPRDYQVQAYQAWVSNNRQGIFAMATGTGKTLTALNCLLEEYREQGYYRALILVPTIALAEQWTKECKGFNFEQVITVSSRSKWADTVAFYGAMTQLSNPSFIIVATYASFVNTKFQRQLAGLSDDIIIIADEAHNVGAPQVKRAVKKLPFERRIGLSATIDRKYDMLGNEAIETFFSDRSPYCFSYSMFKAIWEEPKILCSYTYHPVIVRLTDEEMEEYVSVSRQLTKFIDSQTGKYQTGKHVEMLLLKRKRIIHKAADKLRAFTQILAKEFAQRGHLRFTLVYVPEGQEPNYARSDQYIESAESQQLIDSYTRAVVETDESITVEQYTAQTKDRDSVLQRFVDGRTEVLCSMKCLDEGVDIPRAELAIFCASTGNPRQFIQRRGRILRQHPDKSMAKIYDLIVVPQPNDEQNRNIERSLVRSELERVRNFSTLAVNQIDSFKVLQPTLEYYNLSIDPIP